MTTEIQEYNATEQALSVLREKYADTTYDVDTTAGMKDAKAARSEVKGYRTSLEKMRKDIKAPALERCRMIDSEAKRITVELIALESPIDAQIKEVEVRKEAERQAKIDAEVERVEDIQRRIDGIRSGVDAVVNSPRRSDDIAEYIDIYKGHPITDEFEAFQQTAHDAWNAGLARLTDHLEATKAREAEELKIKAEREELAKLREADEKRQAEDQAKREAAEADARKKREAEEQKQREELETQRKEQERAQAEIVAENKRILEEHAKLERAKAKAEAEKEAEKKRQAKAQADAKKAKYPGEIAIVDALVSHFGVTPEVVMNWLTEIRKAA